ncbi:MAG: hypothetical protein ABFR50_00045 [Candidatus Fermentibacteria bacterium]
MNFRGAFITGNPVTDGSGAGPWRWSMFLISPFTYSFSLACVYLGMRGVMKLGGFVAVGGPYEIAHPAPDWIWVFPVSIMFMIGSMFVSLFSASRISGPNIMALSWSGLFTLLGWNFVQFGFGIGMGGSLAFGWIICAVTFMLMGLIPLIFILRSFFRSLAERMNSGIETGTGSTGTDGQLAWSISLILQVALSVAGFWLGLVFFKAIS